MLAAREFVANGAGRPSRFRWSAASPGRTGSLGRVGQRGLVACQLATLAASSADFRVLAWMRWSRAAGETARPRPFQNSGIGSARRPNSRGGISRSRLPRCASAGGELPPGSTPGLDVGDRLADVPGAPCLVSCRTEDAWLSPDNGRYLESRSRGAAARASRSRPRSVRRGDRRHPRDGGGVRRRDRARPARADGVRLAPTVRYVSQKSRRDRGHRATTWRCRCQR